MSIGIVRYNHGDCGEIRDSLSTPRESVISIGIV